MVNVNDLRPGDRLVYRWEDFDGKGERVVVVSHVFEDHAIAEYGDMRLWIDEYDADMFRKE